MEFGPVPLDEAIGGIAAHSVRLPAGVVKKGTVISRADVALLREAGIASVVIARPGPDDVSEDEAAHRLAQAFAGPGVRVEKPFTGRSNLFAETAGVLVVRRALVDGVNRIDEAITVATLPEWRAVVPGEMIGTVKIITFATPATLLDKALSQAQSGSSPAVSVAPFRPLQVGVVSTLLPGLKPSVVRKTLTVLGERLAPAGATIVADRETPHETRALADAIASLAHGAADLIVVFGASAITDRRDVIPSAVVAAGGRVERFGMPVDPGNLLLLGEVAGKRVLGAPGCARSPKENGFDWVLQRLLAGLPVTGDDIAGMGVGGLLMEIVQRGQPREHGAPDTAGDGPA
ncbi:molybdopterin-binding protein [Alsobacter sp. SYSU M60028]|uniref:Molybdopterin-binding protein n=1 Tax=Alsobacter ponti TaxID=2962936 RepID=A0ABT1LG28_9HYPH|nr:molybdopterin-binding protein [Alsobacter ponti]MCP8940452.1 molybdopterin-binding protein [Alsobacter ponti]